MTTKYSFGYKIVSAVLSVELAAVSLPLSEFAMQNAVSFLESPVEIEDMYAGDIIPVMNGIVNGTVNPSMVTTALETAVEANELVVINLSEASVNQILYYASTSLAA